MRLLVSAVIGMILPTTLAFGQTNPGSVANTDPVVCFDEVLRDAENALQAYSIALTGSWTREADCRRQAPAAPELGDCWDLLLEARPLITQAGNLYEQARRKLLAADAQPLIQQANASMQRAAALVRKARDCFGPVFARWQKNGGRYLAQNEGTSGPSSTESPGAGPMWPIPPSRPPLGPQGPVSPRPSSPQPLPPISDQTTSTAPLSLRIAAHRAADAIIAGDNNSSQALTELNRAQQALPPNVPRPIECWDMMVDARSKRSSDPAFAIQRAKQAVVCYDGSQAAVQDQGRPSQSGPGRLQGHVEQNAAPTGGAGGLPLPDEIRRQLLQKAAEMDRLVTTGQDYSLAASNRFFDCLVRALKADLLFLAQPGYVPAAQIAQSLRQGVWDYITADAYANNRQMFQGALEALRRLKQDPACWFANAAPGAAAAAITHLGGAAAEATEIQKAADAAVRLANTNAERRAAFGAAASGGTSINRFNPENAANMCLPCALAQDLTWATGDPISARTYAGNVEIQIIKGVPTKVYNLTHSKTVETLLSGLYGSTRLQGAPLNATRLQNQMFGIPSASSYQEIVDELRAAGPLSRGLVFFEYPTGPGHVINARNVGKGVVFPDASNSNIDGSSFFQGANRVFWYRTR